jgi:NAD(P)-dependent dehydrogenase (short-subunit alcohol dehydrogenase family)
VADLALVCGAGGTLGRTLVRAFRQRGDSVVAVGRRPLAAEPGVRAEQADLADADAVEALWERLAARGERPRWLVNSAGGFGAGSIAESEPESLQRQLALNLETAWWSCRAAARRMQPGGAIVNVSSRAALTGSAGAVAYAVSKAGVVRMTELLASELAPRAIRVNAILPALIDSEANRASLSTERMRAAVPADAIAPVVAFLCSDGAGAVTGASIPVYGWA